MMWILYGLQMHWTGQLISRSDYAHYDTYEQCEKEKESWKNHIVICSHEVPK